MQRRLYDKQKGDYVLKYGNIQHKKCKVSGIVDRTTERSFSFASGTLYEIEFDHSILPIAI